MRVTKISVSAGRTFNHPYEDYSNLRPSITIDAELQEGDDPILAIKSLQDQSEGLMEEHKAALLGQIEKLEANRRLLMQGETLRSQIEMATRQLQALNEQREKILESPEFMPEDPNERPQF